MNWVSKRLPGSTSQVADNGRKVPGHIREGKRRERIKSLKHIGLPRNQRASEGRVEEIFLREAPGNQFLGIARSGPAKEPLRNAIFDFVGIGESLIFVETDETAEIVHAIHVIVGEFGFDHMFPLSIAIIKDALEYRQTNIDRKLLGIAK